MNIILWILFGIVTTLMHPEAKADTSPLKKIEPVKLSVVFKGLKNTKGKILVWVFNSEQGFPMKAEAALKTVSVALEEGIVPRAQVLGLPAGTYAVSAVHDENDNQKLETNWIGIPREGVATSRDAKGDMGPPKYRDAMLEITRDQEIEVTFEY